MTYDFWTVASIAFLAGLTSTILFVFLGLLIRDAVEGVEGPMPQPKAPPSQTPAIYKVDPPRAA